jgi:hypothetical protein
MHVIRLHGPWTAEITGSGPPETRRVHLPREWSDLAELTRASSVSLLRRFHRPTGLDATTMVILAIPRAWPLAAVTINGQPQQPREDDGDFRKFDISTLIRTQEAHDLRIDFRIGDELLAAPYFVGLEITEPAS